MIVFTTLQLDRKDNKDVGKPDVGQGAFEIFTEHGGTNSRN